MKKVKMTSEKRQVHEIQLNVEKRAKTNNYIWRDCIKFQICALEKWNFCQATGRENRQEWYGGRVYSRQRTMDVIVVATITQTRRHMIGTRETRNRVQQDGEVFKFIVIGYCENCAAKNTWNNRRNKKQTEAKSSGKWNRKEDNDDNGADNNADDDANNRDCDTDNRNYRRMKNSQTTWLSHKAKRCCESKSCSVTDLHFDRQVQQKVTAVAATTALLLVERSQRMRYRKWPEITVCRLLWPAWNVKGPRRLSARQKSNRIRIALNRWWKDRAVNQFERFEISRLEQNCTRFRCVIQLVAVNCRSLCSNLHTNWFSHRLKVKLRVFLLILTAQTKRWSLFNRS